MNEDIKKEENIDGPAPAEETPAEEIPAGEQATGPAEQPSAAEPEEKEDKKLKKLKAENAELKAELARPERMTPAESNAYWGIFG